MGFPDSDVASHQLRPLLLGAFCFLPALAALCYTLSGSLDRYLTRQFMGGFGICALGLTLIWILLDLNDHGDSFSKAADPAAFIIRYYATTFPPVFVLLAPFSLLLGLLLSLGKLSNSREIIAIIQTGRGVARTVAPFTMVGIFISIACLLLNYHWAPWGEGYRRALIEEAEDGSSSRARTFLFFQEDGRRLWFVGRFPYNYADGAPLRDVIITTKDENNRIVSRLKAPLATWNSGTREWLFQDAELLSNNPLGMPTFENLPSPYSVMGWSETPWQLVRPGLSPEHLGIPELRSWLKENSDSAWEERRPFLTQWHYRWAQPWACLVVVLLATPLGIVFTRRGVAGGVSVALILCAFMLLSAEVFLALGDSGYLSPTLAAWSTNGLFTLLALALISRRLQGRPIYQTLKSLLPAN
jgi:lipopolysaccharide export system permease protein